MYEDGIINRDEFERLTYLIKINKPAVNYKNGYFWWKKGKRKPRVEFLKKLIKMY